LEHYRDGGEAQIIGIGRELEARRKDGTLFPMELSVAEFQVGEERHFTGIIRDITERKQVQERLLRERQSAFAELAHGVSHNLNNILSSVLLPAQFLLKRNDDPEVVRLEAEHIVMAGERARDLVQRLSDAVRPGEASHAQAVDLNRQIQQSVELSRPRWKDESAARGITVDVVTELDTIPHVQGNLGELSEVILNLLLNAVDAMPEGGTISISTDLADEDGFVSLTVSDTGTGMNEETRRRVFEPFFTTKVDVGSGLGLSTAHGSVTRSGGTLEVESEVGQGTTFKVRLPVFEGEKAEEAAVTGEGHPVRSGKILLVEDDEMVCEVLKRILSEKHTVEVVHDGAAALQAFTPGRFDVALIDLGIPTVPGDKVAADMREQDPALVTVLSTGWVLEESDPRSEGFDLHLQKPILGPDLDEVIATAMVLHDSRV